MKKKKTLTIADADRFFRLKRFSEVIRILEPQIFNYRDNWLFYYLLGFSYLFLDDLGGAESYLRRAGDIKRENLAVKLGMAYIYYIRGKTDEALKVWLNVLELKPGNRTASLGLSYVKKGYHTEKAVPQKKLDRLKPRLRFKSPLPKILLFFLILGGGVYGSYRLLYHTPPQRPGISGYDLKAVEKGLLAYEGHPRFTLSAKEVEARFNKAKDLFTRYRDNLAMVEINRILHSNASSEVKNMADLLKSHIIEPDFTNIKDSFSLSEVLKSPLLYDGCYVLWKGKLGDLNVGEKAITFNFWVGDQRSFEGVVPVTLHFAQRLEEGMELEVLGQLKSLPSGSSLPVALEGRGIHRLPE